ncbi:protein jagunal homolog 1-like [Amphiura filiformis]|uniref:protein jagunal homolog 1-like n=1 Tax=Amphiura filiformis TaxID=82378 RepID=UPI003B220227
MSSREGPRAVGSDGSDFTHREQVASQYVISVQLKSKLKTYLLLNAFLASVQGILLIWSHLKIIQVEPLPWQYMWFASLIPSLIGLTSLPRNRQIYLRLSNAGTVALGMGGMLFGILHHFDALKEFLTKGKADVLVGDTVPLVVCLYLVFTVMVGLYLLTLYYANNLINAWSSKKAR